MLMLVWISGRAARRYREQAERLRRLAARLEEQREVVARLTVVEERARMARELHDTIAHKVSGMIVQAAAAETVLTTDRERARLGLVSVQTTGRDAVAELRRMLRILRDNAPSERPPPPDPSPAPRRLVPVSWWPRVDVLLGVGCFAAVELAILTDSELGSPERLVAALLAALATLPLVARRRFPIATFTVIVAAVTAIKIVITWDAPPDLPTPRPTTYETPPALSIAALVALFSVAENAPLRQAIPAAAASVIAAVAADTVIMDRFGGVAVVLVFGFFAAFAVVPGRGVRLLRRQADQLRILTARLERERSARRRLAIVEERTRLARELHDAIAHGVSVMVLQAGAAERVLASAPDTAHEATRAVQDVGRTVLDEVRRLLGVLGGGELDRPGGPPGLAELDALLTDVRGAGLPVELHVYGTSDQLPAGMAASAYRVIQESLTNALKHAGTVPTSVTLRYDPDVLTVEVVNASGDHEAGPTGRHAGHGLIGMRERVALYDGELDAGPRPTGGFAVRATLPLDGGQA
jgi:signal transduction histidine kinase